jgi:hypothetical protein
MEQVENNKKKTKLPKSENAKKIARIRRHPIHHLMEFHSLVMTMLTGMVGTGSVEEVTNRFLMMKTSEPLKYSTTRTMFRNMSRDAFGTWAPSIKFRSAAGATIVSVTGIITSVVRLRPADLCYFNAFSGIFDEFRFKGQIKGVFRPAYEPGTSGLTWPFAVGVIDLVDSTVLASTAGALMYDTAQIFALGVAKAGPVHSEWQTRLIGQPDLVWLDTSSQSTDVAYFKTYNYANVSGSLTYGYFEWHAEIEFRQLYGV